MQHSKLAFILTFILDLVLSCPCYAASVEPVYKTYTKMLGKIACDYNIYKNNDWGFTIAYPYVLTPKEVKRNRLFSVQFVYDREALITVSIQKANQQKEKFFGILDILPEGNIPLDIQKRLFVSTDAKVYDLSAKMITRKKIHFLQTSYIFKSDFMGTVFWGGVLRLQALKNKNLYQFECASDFFRTKEEILNEFPKFTAIFQECLDQVTIF